MEGTSKFAKEREVALAIVAKTCKLIKGIQDKLVSEETLQKKDRSPVTVADFAAQAVVISELSRAFPGYPFIAEETSKQLRQQEDLRRKVLEHVQTIFPDATEQSLLDTIDRGKTEKIEPGTNLWWTLDPIDGTLGFLRKEQYAVALALMENNEPVLGLLGCPNLFQQGCIFVAIKGEGTFKRSIDDGDEQPVHVSAIDDPTRANFTESVEASHSSHHISKEIASRLGVTAEPVRMDSQCKYGVVATGDACIYLRLTSSTYSEKIWDHAAGALIVTEAGGQVTDLHGLPLDFSQGRTLAKNQGVVATNGKLHSAVLAAVKEVLAHNPL